MSEGASGSAGNSSNALVYFFGALGGMLFGYDTGVISGAILFIEADLGLNAFSLGLVVSSLLLGAMAGAGIDGPLSARLGRRRIILIAAINLTVGVAVGAAALIVPLYLSEVAPTEIRGAVSSLNQLMIVVGILLAYIVNALLAASEAWRTMLGLAVVPSLVLLVGMYFMPETPRWLVSRGRDDEAREVLRQTRNEEAVEQEVTEIKEVE